MKLGEWLLLPWFVRPKTPSWALVPYHISIVQRAIGLPMGGLDIHMSQHYSPHHEAQSLLSAEARHGNKSKITQKLILLVSHYGTIGNDIRLPTKLHVRCELVIYYHVT